jgi:hypothetical protein
MSEDTKSEANTVASDSLNPTFNPEEYGIGVEAIKGDVDQLIKQGIEAKECKGLFMVKTANRWVEQARTRPIPKMLFGEFWFEGELCILFADTNLGKSILAVQIGNSISRGEPIPGFKLEALKQPILYFDFELSEKQFENRYSLNFDEHYIFDDNFIRVEINPDAEIPDSQSFESYLNHSLERSITETGSKVLIIDNLTYLKNGTETSRDALPLMKDLKALKNKYGLSILVLAHTPKRDLSKPITRNDLQGSKMLINFCDSSFSIGESQVDKSIRYLKQIKQRNTEHLYDAENVCVCEIDKPHNFLKFGFTGYGTEWDHLKQRTEEDKANQIERITELANQGKSLREISAELGCSHMKVSRVLKKGE